MDITQAKEALRRTFLAYQERGADGCFVIPPVHQRPVLLLGPPGIGKTAILRQLAGELDVGLVSYTMTHHTRQSALGLPRIAEETYDGVPCAVTRYTMSEILAAVYDQMAATGRRTGILFLDEINCVSETLVPAMLELLQEKRFGVHRLPEGWVIAAAGNPPQYNPSARPFDTVTLDRVKLLEVEPDLAGWQRYAAARGVHPAILSYLTLNPGHFYRVEPNVHGRGFVTARGWEDPWRMRCSPPTSASGISPPPSPSTTASSPPTGSRRTCPPFWTGGSAARSRPSGTCASTGGWPWWSCCSTPCGNGSAPLRRRRPSAGASGASRAR